MRKKYSRAREFLHNLIGTKENDCIKWPMLIEERGYGLAVFEGKRWRAHNYMCHIAYGEPSSGREAAHSCHNRSCVNPNHLRWATRSENCADKIKDGTAQFGENHPCAKITEQQAREIIFSKEPNQILAARYGLTPQNVSKIKTGSRWKHLSNP